MLGRWMNLTAGGAAILTAAFAALGTACSDGSEATNASSAGQAAVTPPSNLPPPLRNVPVPEPDNLGEFIKDKAAAIALGKALFWDMQVGSDGKTACATCHFHAGADSRSKNQLAPGILRRNADYSPNPDLATTFGHNYQLRPSDFPFHKLSNVDDRTSTVLFDTNDIAASQGVTFSSFVDIQPGSPTDTIQISADPQGFSVGSVNVRRVEPRNTPTVINAVFNYRQFWDGRAQFEFNGVNAFGDRDPYAFVYKAPVPSKLEQVRLSIKKASLASQALAPPLSSFEMSAEGRTFVEIGDKINGDTGNGVKVGKKLPRKTGKKLSMLTPLAAQLVAKDDSVLGPYSRFPQPGLTKSYSQLIEAAFKPEWVKASKVIQIAPDGSRVILNKNDRNPNTEEYTLAEYNFGLIFGLAIQLYEATLVSDDTPFDRYTGGDRTALTEQQQRGMVLFFDTVRVRCVNCHGGAEFTDASFAKVSTIPLRRREGNLQDRGFNNIGLRPTTEDIGIGDIDPWGLPLSHARLATLGLFTDPAVSPPVGPNEALSDDGAFKTPTVRNVELTAPYFHNGGALTLRQVVEFYSRGGDFVGIKNRSGQTINAVHIVGLNDAEKDALVAFMVGLTDERVRTRKAPFDHPQLFVPDGHEGDETAVVNDGTGNARDVMLEIPAVGRNGGAPLPNFLEGVGTGD